MIDTKGNPKEEVNLLRHSVVNYIESIDKLYGFYTDKIVKENIDTLINIMSEPWEIKEFTEKEIRTSFERSFNEKESILNSLFFFSISIIENTLCKTGFLVNNNISERIDTKKVQGKYIEKLKLFIESKLEFQFDSIEWNNILEYYEIRNRFIHNAGVEDKRDALRYETQFGIKFDDYYGILIVNETFLAKVCVEIKTFLTGFLLEVEKRISTLPLTTTII